MGSAMLLILRNLGVTGSVRWRRSIIWEGGISDLIGLWKWFLTVFQLHLLSRIFHSCRTFSSLQDDLPYSSVPRYRYLWSQWFSLVSFSESISTISYCRFCFGNCCLYQRMPIVMVFRIVWIIYRTQCHFSWCWYGPLFESVYKLGCGSGFINNLPINLETFLAWWIRSGEFEYLTINAYLDHSTLGAMVPGSISALDVFSVQFGCSYYAKNMKRHHPQMKEDQKKDE